MSGHPSLNFKSVEDSGLLGVRRGIRGRTFPTGNAPDIRYCCLRDQNTSRSASITGNLQRHRTYVGEGAAAVVAVSVSLECAAGTLGAAAVVITDNSADSEFVEAGASLSVDEVDRQHKTFKAAAPKEVLDGLWFT